MYIYIYTLIYLYIYIYICVFVFKRPRGDHLWVISIPPDDRLGTLDVPSRYHLYCVCVIDTPWGPSLGDMETLWRPSLDPQCAF